MQRRFVEGLSHPRQRDATEAACSPLPGKFGHPRGGGGHQRRACDFRSKAGSSNQSNRIADWVLGVNNIIHRA